MADTDIVSFEGLEASLTPLQEGLRKLELARNTVGGKPFPGYTNNQPDLAGRYLGQYENGINDTYKLANNVLTAIEGFINDNKPDPEDPGGSEGPGGSGGSGGPGGSGAACQG